MKNIFLLLLLTIVTDYAFGQGDAPPFVKGQGQASKSLATIIEVPNSQATKTSSAKSLIETGNSNLLENPSFEHSTFNTGWTCTGITPTVETSIKYQGAKSLKIAASASTFECYQHSTINASNYANTQFLAYLRALTTATGTSLKVCSRINGTTSTSNCVDILSASNPLNNGIFNLIKLPTNAGSTSTGISIAGVSVTGNIYIDDAFVGAVDLKTDAPSIAVQTSFVNSVTSFASGVAVSGALSTTKGSGLYSYNSSTGIYTVLKPAVFNLGFQGVNGTASPIDVVIGVNGANVAVDSTISGSGASATAYYGAKLATGDTFYFFVLSASTGSQRISVVATESVNGSTYSSNNADKGYTSFTPTGTWSTSTATYTGKWKRIGENIEVIYSIAIFGVPTATALYVDLPPGVVADTARAFPGASYPAVGNGSYWDVSTGTAGILSTLLGSSTQILPSYQSSLNGNGSAFNSTTPIVWAAGDSITFRAIFPVVGWDNSNIIIGQFNGLESCTDSYQCEDTYSAKVAADGTVSAENLEWITGNAVVSDTSLFTFTLKSGLSTVPMNCLISNAGANGVTDTEINNVTSSSVVARVTNSTNGSKVAVAFTLLCQKQGADYLGKTAKAVASDANVRSIGSIGVDVQSVYFGIGTNCALACTTGTCAICRQVGSKITSVTRSSTGLYRLNGIDGTKYQCAGSGYSSTYGSMAALYDASSSTSTYGAVFVSTSGAAAGVDSAFNSITCIGIP